MGFATLDISTILIWVGVSLVYASNDVRDASSLLSTRGFNTGKRKREREGEIVFGFSRVSRFELL